MKTLSVRPVFVESKDVTGIWKDLVNTIHIAKTLTKSNAYDTQGDWIPQQLILISLDPDEKIEVGDTGYINIGGGIIGEISYDNKYHTWDLTTSDNIHYPFSTRDYIKKVIATQPQLSPDLINQLVAEYNNGGMQDFEIEMEEYDHDEEWSDIGGAYETFKIRIKLTNGFVTVVDTVIGKPLDDYIKEKHSQDRRMGFIDGYNVRKSEEPINYNEEEVNLLLHKYLDDHSILNTDRNHAIMDVWFNENKKK